ncbi:MAG: hypothetical protein IPJ34_39155 [Myxococcales bacterium]|nr:hypothetical protein [Myxococcales bacterium]
MDPRLGALMLSAVRSASDTWLRRALGYVRDLGRLGVAVPPTILHDVGLVLAAPQDQRLVGARRQAEAVLAGRANTGPAHARYVAAIQALDEDPAVAQIRKLRPSDDLVVVLLVRLLGAQNLGPGLLLTDVPEPVEVERNLTSAFERLPLEPELALLARFVERLPRILVLLDTLDLDTLQLLTVYGKGSADLRGDSSAIAGLAQVELLSALTSLQANDVVNFSLELLPSVLETTRRSAPGTYATGGYQGLTRRGSLDSLVLTELAWDDEELARRLLDDEVLFHARERAEDQAPRVHLVLVDASASMRGDRTTFARGVAIALAKRLELEGEEVRIRFFDSRLYETAAASRGRGRQSLAASLPHVLSFRGERGRSPERVLRQLVSELEVLKSRDKRSPVVHLITSAAFYAPRPLVAEVRARGSLFGVFITPQLSATGEPVPLELDWLDLLDGHYVVDQAILGKRADRSARAKEIVRGMPAQAAEPPPSSIRTSTLGPPASTRLEPTS